MLRMVALAILKERYADRGIENMQHEKQNIVGILQTSIGRSVVPGKPDGRS